MPHTGSTILGHNEMRLRTLLLLLVTLSACLARPHTCLAAQTAAEAQASRFADRDRTTYTLPPEKLQKAVALERTRILLTVGGTLWAIAQLVLVLALGIVAQMRDLALRLSGNRWVQGFAFVFLLVLLLGLCDLPLAIYGHHAALGYGLSVQGWGSWLGDRAKVLGLEWLIGGLMTMLMFWVIRKSPTRWWLWFWIPAVLCSVGGVFLTPYVIDPLFNRFEPLANSDPALVMQLERVVARGGLSIPPERMFLMRASAKSTEMNAYVTGFGASKRVVVWDTTIAKSTPDEIAFLFAHEMGHYALNHIPLGVTLTCVALLPFFWLGYHGQRWLLRRYSVAWCIHSQQDWGALVVLLLVLTTIATFAEPIENTFSRTIEHNADVYGQEAIHGIVGDPQAVAQRSFQVLGEESFDDPTPHPLFDSWFDTHPSIRFRAAYAEAYDPWAPGMRPKYIAK
jgi:Zn-dependent protease with chaperone function